MFTYQQVVQSRYPIKFHESWDFLHHKFHSHLSELQNLSSTKFQLFPNKNVHTSTRNQWIIGKCFNKTRYFIKSTRNQTYGTMLQVHKIPSLHIIPIVQIHKYKFYVSLEVANASLQIYRKSIAMSYIFISPSRKPPSFQSPRKMK